MAFSTNFFLFLFFPITITAYMICKFLDNRFKIMRSADTVLILFSFAFFATLDADKWVWLLGWIIVVYATGLVIARLQEKAEIWKARLFFGTGVVVLLLLLGYYKYAGFTISILNGLFSTSLVLEEIVTPLGISFITFTSISYFADIFLNKGKPGNIIDCALYIAFFPKLISGPIVLWRDFSAQLMDRRVSLDDITSGINKICIGLAKKVILADTFGKAIHIIDNSHAVNGIDQPTAWLAVILFWLQIYYDFAGYSDMAIGLSRIFGFKFEENFRFPYLSCSVSEFWRRWHISLGTWFREYVYFPLGGSRCSRMRTSVNLGIVFLLTGIWHGAGILFLLWGFINGFFVIAEHLLRQNKYYQAIPKVLLWLCTSVIVICFWELFRFHEWGHAKEWLEIMFGFKIYADITFTWQYFLSRSLIFYMTIAFLGGTIIGMKPVQEIGTRLGQSYKMQVASGVFYLIIFVLSMIFVVNSTYSPFIYYQF